MFKPTVVAYPDRGTGNDPEASGLVHSQLEGLKQSMIWPWRRFCTLQVLSLVHYIIPSFIALSHH